MPTGYGMPAVDFGILGDLGKTYKTSRDEATLADLGKGLASGMLDERQAAGLAAQAGRLDIALPLWQKAAQREAYQSLGDLGDLGKLYGGGQQQPTMGTVGQQPQPQPQPTQPDTMSRWGVSAPPRQSVMQATEGVISAVDDKGFDYAPGMRAAAAAAAPSPPPSVAPAVPFQPQPQPPPQPPPQAPPTAAPAMAPPAQGGLDPRAVLLLKKIMNPDLPPETRQALMPLLQKFLPEDDKIHVLSDGTVLSINDRTGAKRVIHQAGPTWGVIGEGALGDKTYGWIDRAGQKVSTPQGGTPGGPGTAQGVLAKGVTEINNELVGEAYFNQFSPEVKAAAQAYMTGAVMPTGNPRQKAIASFAKTVAQKYALDIGRPDLADDALYPARRKMNVDLASSGANTIGGIISNGKSAFGHLVNLSDKFVELDNASGPSIPGGAHVGSASNFFGNVVFPTAETKGKIVAVNDNALKYGQEATKFYAGSGGGEAERMNALSVAKATTSTAAEHAAFLQTEKELMLERLRQKEAQIRDTLGEDYLKRKPVMTADVQHAIAKLDMNIAWLRGERGGKAAPGAPTAQGGPPQGAAPPELEAEMRRRGLLK